MHFRERNQIIQIIRTKYDAVEKKGKSEIVGRLQKANPTLTAELTSMLTKEERKEVEAWIASYSSLGRLKRAVAARTLQEQLDFAQEWFADQKGDDARLLVASLMPAWARLRVTLKKSGLIE